MVIVVFQQKYILGGVHSGLRSWSQGRESSWIRQNTLRDHGSGTQKQLEGRVNDISSKYFLLSINSSLGRVFYNLQERFKGAAWLSPACPCDWNLDQNLFQSSASSSTLTGLLVVFLFFFKNIYLAVLSLSCGTQDLWSLFWHVGSLAVAHGI